MLIFSSQRQHTLNIESSTTGWVSTIVWLTIFHSFLPILLIIFSHPKLFTQHSTVSTILKISETEISWEPQIIINNIYITGTNVKDRNSQIPFRHPAFLRCFCKVIGRKSTEWNPKMAKDSGYRIQEGTLSFLKSSQSSRT